MKLKEAVTKAWRIYKGFPYNSLSSVVVYRDKEDEDSFFVEEFAGDWWIAEADEILRLSAERWYTGTRRPKKILLRDALALARKRVSEITKVIK